MKRLSPRQILDLLTEFCYLAIIFLLPIYFALFLKNANVFELNKIILFKILILLLLLLTLVKIIKDIRGPIGHRMSWRWRFKSLVIPLFFLLSLTLATVFSIDTETSFYGLYDRQQGLISHLYYFLFFILLLLNIKTAKQINRIIKAFVFSSVFVCLYGLIQAAGLDPLNWIESTSLRITSTFGQPNILASYLLLVMPPCIYLLLISQSRIIKSVYGAVFILQFLNLIFTYSRGAWLGFIAGLFIFVIFIVKPRRLKIQAVSYFKNINYKIIVILFLLSGILVFYSLFSFYQKSYVLKYRIDSFFNLNSGSIALRVNFWQASIDAIKKKPLLGYGLESQKEVLASYYTKDWAVFSKPNTSPNRAHNLCLDVLLTTGLIGLIAYLALLYLFFSVLFDNIKNNKNKLLSWAIFLGVVSYLASLMFNFSFVVGDVCFWLYFALAILISRNIILSEARQKKELQEDANLFVKKNNRFNFINCLIFFSKILLILAVSAGIFIQINKQIKILIADYYFQGLQIAREDNDFFKALVYYDYIKDLSIRDIYYQKQYALILSDWLKDLDKYGVVYRRTGEKVLKEILDEVKFDNYYNNFVRAKIHTTLANEENTDYYNLAKENFKKVIDYSPEMPRNYRELAKMYFKKGDYDKAIENYQISLSKLPEIDNPYLNILHLKNISYEMYLNYLSLGDAYIQKGDFAKAEDYHLLAQQYK